MTSYTFDGHLEIDARVLAGRLELRSCEPGRAEVEVTADTTVGQAWVDEARIELDDRGARPRLVVHVPRDGGRPLFTLRNPSVQVTIQCPEGTDLRARTASASLDARLPLGRVEVDSASGRVALGDARDRVEVTTASGDVRIEDVRGTVSVRTASGDIAIGEVEGPLTARTASGDVATGVVSGAITLRTVSGDVSIGGAAGDDVSIQSTSGDVLVTVPSGRGVHLDVATVSGSLSSDLDDDDGSGGVDLDLRARTVSGDVRLRRGTAAAAPPG